MAPQRLAAFAWRSSSCFERGLIPDKKQDGRWKSPRSDGLHCGLPPIEQKALDGWGTDNGTC